MNLPLLPIGRRMVLEKSRSNGDIDERHILHSHRPGNRVYYQPSMNSFQHAAMEIKIIFPFRFSLHPAHNDLLSLAQS
ncbi:uncharacterized [Tachysurus ichikawai]